MKCHARRTVLIGLCFAACFAAGQVLAADAARSTAVRRMKVGDQITSLSLNDARGAKWSLADAASHPVVVLAFLGTECPLVKSYGPRLRELAAEFGPRGVAFIGINSNQQDSLSEIVHFAKVHEIDFPLMKDAGNVVADQLGAQRTPEVFVLDADRRIRYHGRIDDQFSYGVQRPRAIHQDLADALESLLAGRPVAVQETEVVGCHIGRVLKAQSVSAPAGSVLSGSDVTYARDISRIFNRRCVECHREGQVGPFALTSYDESVGWAEMIREVVKDDRMPPWHASPSHGEFANDMRLTSREKDLIDRWVDAGAPRGDLKDLPEMPQFTEGWRIGQPDEVFYMSEKAFQVPASGEVKYQYFVVDPGFQEDKWVKAAECRPGNRAVVHHIIVAAGNRGRLGTRGGDDIASDWLAATAPGARPLMLPAGLAKRIPAGSKLIFQMHYTPNGKAQEDRSCIGLIYADPSEVKHEVVTQKAANSRFKIPPGDPNYKVESAYTVDQDSILLAAFPHMHLRGKSFRYTARFPDGREEVLLDVPRFDFNWQNSYVFKTPISMPAGTRIHCVAHFDNSPENPANPDPSVSVRWGDQTWEEMMIGYFDIMPMKEDSKVASATVCRTAEFARRAAAGEVKLSDYLRKSASEAPKSSAGWTEYYDALRAIAPQLDRVCWTTVANGKLTVERAAQEIPFRRLGGEGTTVPAANMLLADHASAETPVVHAHLDGLNAPDFQLMRRVFGSSVHIPAMVDGKRGVISFWSTETNAFSADAVRFFEQAVRQVTAGP